MGRIPQDVIDRVLAAHDVVEVVGRTVSLKKAGRVWKSLCPFHEEKTPSFTVNPERQSFKCFGCGKGGNVFGWLMERERVAFPEAVRMLAAERQIPVPDERGRPDPGASRVGPVREALAFAQDLFVRTLWGPAGAGARAYLARRGFPEEASRRFGLGLSPDGWDGLLTAARAAGLAPETLDEAGLVRERESGGGWYDRFRGRLMFPVADVAGRVVTFGARALREDDQPKYLNGPETAVFKKSRTLYGLDRAKDGIRRAGHALLMEGYTDVLVAHLHGFDAAVAGMGTAFTPEQGRSLASFTGRVVLVYDGDAAGRAAAERSLDLLLEQGLEVRVALLPDGRDVDEVLLEDGVERFEAVLSGALDVFDFLALRLREEHDLATERGRAQAAARMAATVVRVKSPMERDLLLSRVADRLGVKESLLRAEAAALATGRRRPGGEAGAGAAGGGPAPDPIEAARRKDLALEHEGLVAAAVFAPEHRAAVLEVLPREEVADEGLRAVLDAVAEIVGRGLVPTPQAVARAVAADPAASAAFAGLPDDLPFADWAPDAVRRRRAVRALEERRRAVLHGLAGAVGPAQNLPPAAGPLPP